jgi:WD40 repeat protein/serine/threonine protein kinase
MLLPGESLLNSSPPTDASSLDSQLLEACEELEALLRSGQPARAEEQLDRRPSLSQDPERALDLIYVEYSVRRELGETPVAEEFLERFPQWRDLLQRQFQLDDLLDEGPALLEEGDGCSAPTQAAASSASRFRIQGPLASGGIGQVMRALDMELRREVAVKEIQPALAGNQEVRARFLREAEITGQLEHPGIVPVYGLGRDASGQPFYAMRLVRGQTLQQAVKEFHDRPASGHRFFGLEFQKLLRRFLHVCQTVAYAHSRGVIHRDLKPENILLGPFGETLVVDWGLAKVTAADDVHPARPSASAAEPHEDSQESAAPTVSLSHLSGELTRDAGEWIGTPPYMSPEQALGQAQRVGPAGDVYSLGATLYVLLTGQAPIVGSSVEKTLRQVIDGDFPRPRELSRAVPPPLEAVCLKAMARRPEDRYASPNELAEDIERWLADDPVSAWQESVAARIARWSRRNRTRVVAAALALIAVTVVSLAAAVLINGERLRTERQRIEADRRTARLAFDRGYGLTQDHEYGTGLLWYGRALAHAPPDDAPLRRVILTNMDATRHHLLRRRATFAHSANLVCAAMSADGKQLATADYNDIARLWDIDSGEILAERKLEKRAEAAYVAGDGTAVFATAIRKTIVIETLPEDSAESGSPTTFDNVEDVDSAAFSYDGNLLVAGGHVPEGPAHARVWNLSNGELVAKLPHPRSVQRVVFRPGREDLATTCSDGQMRLWDVKSARPQWELKLESGRVEQVAFTPDGQRVLIGDSEGVLCCYDVAARRRQFELARESGVVTAVACAGDRRTVAAAWSNGTARTWNLEDRRQLWELLRIDRHTQLLSFRPQTRQMLVASEPRSAVLWDIPDPSQIGVSLGQGQMSSVAFSADRKAVVTGSLGGTVVFRDAATGKELRRATSHQKAVTVVAFSDDGSVVLSASHDGTAQLIDSETGQPRGKLMDHRMVSVNVQVETAIFSTDGRTVLTGDNIGRVQIWDAASGALVRVLARYKGSVRSLCLSPSSDRMAVGVSTPDNGVHVWDLASGKLLWTGRHGHTVRSVRFNFDGSLVLSASNDVTARLWSAADGSPVGKPMPHRGEVFIAEFSPDGSLAATGGYDATVRLWEVPTGRPVGEPMQHEGVVTAADFSTDGKLLLTGGSLDRSARLWDVTTCLPLSPPLVHNWTMMSVGLHPSGHVGYTGRLWKLPSPLPDKPELIDLWVKLATQRTFRDADNIERLRPEEVAAAAQAFQARTGKPWDQWVD